MIAYRCPIPAIAASSGKPVAADNAIRLILRAEAAVVFVLALVAYRSLGASWWLFAALFLAPDLAMLGYLKGPRIGAAFYNSVHTYLAPAALVAIAYLAGSPLFVVVAVIWAAHIGFDRILGYGLKLPTGFGDTHLGSKGR
jgi:hypothetical protein